MPTGLKNDKNLAASSNMPKVGGASIAIYQDKLQLITTTQIMDEGDVVITESRKDFMGAIQPLQATQIELKPEGQRSWRWYQIHCLDSTFNLKENDIVLFLGTKFKIMAKLNYTFSGYVEYHAVEQYD